VVVGVVDDVVVVDSGSGDADADGDTGVNSAKEGITVRLNGLELKSRRDRPTAALGDIIVIIPSPGQNKRRMVENWGILNYDVMVYKMYI
jgi:hypothetical protein